MDKTTKAILGTVAMWLFGLFILNRVLVVSGSYYPMLDEFTPNPNYNEQLSTLMLYVGIGWSVLCLVLGYLWSNHRDEG